EALRDERYRAIARTVETQMDGQRRGVTAEFTLKNGRTVQSRVVHAAKGHQDNPQTTEEMIEKYRDCVRHGPKALTEERTEKAKDMTLHLEDVADVRDVIRLLA